MKLRTPQRHHQRGLTLIELMVGLALSLTLVAAALLALTQHLRESGHTITEARLMQDLRIASDVMARDLRRAGFWDQASTGVWHPGSTGIQSNPFATLETSADKLSLSYSQGGSEGLAYRLHNEAIEVRMGAGRWQAMTDSTSVRVSSLRITPRTQEIVLSDFCSQPCPEGSSSTCPPRQQLRSVVLALEARAAHHPALVRRTHTTVRLRNDALIGACPP